MEITHGSSGGGGTPGGDDTEVQFNDNGAFGGDPGLTYDKTTNILSADTIAVSKIKDPTSTFSALFYTGDLATDRTYTFPNVNGTVALTTDIPSPLSLQTDGVANGSQTLLNLAEGTNIDITDNGTGTVTIDASQQITLQTDGTPNGSQTLLNLVAGTNIDLTDNGTGSITIDASGGGGVTESFVIAMAVAL